MEIVGEEWRPVAGEFAGLPYLVSSRGRIRSQRSDRLLTPYPNHDGYACVSIKTPERDRNLSKRRCRIVAMAFVDGYSPELQVNHKDGKKRDNRPANLEWVTCKQNHIHAVGIGLRERIGVGHFRRKLTLEQADLIRLLIARGVAIAFLARWFGVSKQSIRILNRGLTYRE